MKNFASTFWLIFIAILSPAHAAPSISGGEKVNITITGVPATEQTSINGDYIVGDDGKLFLPMIKKGISAAGSSSSTVARRIETAYKSAKIYASPRITIVTLRDIKEGDTIGRKFVTVAGHVKQPGPVQYSENLTIYDAVATAGDADAFGAMNRVELLRNGKKYTYDLEKTKDRLLKVYPNDKITVPQKNWRGR